MSGEEIDNGITQAEAQSQTEAQETAEISRHIEEAIAKNDLERVVDLLEDVLVRNPRSEFVGQTPLENTLILSAAKVHPERVMGLVARLNRYDTDLAETLLDAGLEGEANEVLVHKRRLEE
jgi:hypothetical protein